MSRTCVISRGAKSVKYMCRYKSLLENEQGKGVKDNPCSCSKATNFV